MSWSFTSIRAPTGATCENLDSSRHSKTARSARIAPPPGGDGASNQTLRSLHARPQLCRGMAARARSNVDLLQFAFSPLDGVFRRHALYSLRVHVGHDVLGERLGSLRIRR